jgi:hypothetical protein
VIGSYAIAVYGYIRATGDIDIWINPIQENAGSHTFIRLCGK